LPVAKLAIAVDAMVLAVDWDRESKRLVNRDEAMRVCYGCLVMATGAYVEVWTRKALVADSCDGLRCVSLAKLLNTVVVSTYRFAQVTDSGVDGIAVGLAQVLELWVVGKDLRFGNSRLEAVCWVMTSLLLDAGNAIIHIRANRASDELFFRKDCDILGYVWSSGEGCI